MACCSTVRGGWCSANTATAVWPGWTHRSMRRPPASSPWPYGLPGQDDDPEKELPFSGVYRLAPDGQVTLLLDSLSRPNGIAFAPDARTCYIANSDPDHAIWLACDVADDGTFEACRVFFDATAHVRAGEPGLPDGLKVHPDGTVWATGPDGVWVFSPEGEVLGRIRTGLPTANCAFDEAHRTLYMTANSLLLRLALRAE